MVIEESLLMDKTNLRLLTQINYPEDLRKLSVEELPEVCRELREDIIQEVSVNPGHFASRRALALPDFLGERRRASG